LGNCCLALATLGLGFRRDFEGISQDKLSKLVGVTLHTLTKIEIGATADPRIETLKKNRKGAECWR